ncbi:MAG: helicase-related protein, partial [Thermoplasmata archaeon]
IVKFHAAEPNPQLPRIILATMKTAASDDFLEFIQQAKRPIVVVDEVHRLGSPVHRRILQLDFGAKLGLSATPERLWDKEGSDALARAFGERPVFELPIGAAVHIDEDSQKQVPVIGHFLSRYHYEFETVMLTQKEQRHWDSLTRDIKELIARDPSQLDEGLLAEGSTRLKMMLIRRARILKKARNKLQAVEKIISERYPSKGRWLVYCEDKRQLDGVTSRLRASLPHTPIMKYDSRMDQEERRRVLGLFEENPGIVVCIRCLDEGVDVPSADGAVILASSKNPREYIQRRGRVLRRAIGKGDAVIVDTIVLPAPRPDGGEDPLSIVRGELARAYTFATHSLNREVTHRLWRICNDYGVRLEFDSEIGFQEDDGEEQ